MKKTYPAVFIALLACALLTLLFSGACAESRFVVNGKTLDDYEGMDEEVTVPDGVEILGSWTFDNSKNMKRIILPETLRKIESGCFYDCEALEEITIPASVTVIEDTQVFAGCTSLTAIHVEEGNGSFISVDGVLFSKDLSTLLYYPAGRKTETYAIPDGTKQVNETSFQDAQIGKLYIPASVKKMQTDMLYTLDSLQAFEVEQGNKILSSRDGVLCSPNGKEICCYPRGMQKKEMGPEDFPEGTEIIGGASFGKTEAERIILPETVTMIRERAFCESVTLREVVVPDSVKQIRRCAFENCPNLELVILANGDIDIIRKGEMSIVDCSPNAVIAAPAGARVEGYCSDFQIPFVSLEGTLEEMTAKAWILREEYRLAQEAEQERKREEEYQEKLKQQAQADAEWAAAWPPADKEKSAGTDNLGANIDYSTTFFISKTMNLSQLYRFIPLYLQAKDDGEKEKVLECHVTFLSGKEQMRTFYYPQKDKEGQMAITLDWSHITEPGTAEFRIDMVSEHYWYSLNAKPVIADADTWKVELLSADAYIPVGTLVNIADLFSLREFVAVEPKMEYRCGFSLPDGTETETDSYLLSGWYHFLAKEPGDYPVELNVWIGDNYQQIFPVTLHASSRIHTAYVEGDAPESLYGARKRAERMKEEAERLSSQLDQYEGVHQTEEAVIKYRKTGTGIVIVQVVPFSRNLTIPGSVNGFPVVRIGDNVLKGWEQDVASLTVGEGVREIAGNAFLDCVNLEEVHLPSTLRKIGPRAFAGTAAENIEVPGSVTSLAGSWHAGEMRTDSTGKWDYRLLEDGTAILTSYEYTEKLSIPAAVDGIPVTVVEASEKRSLYVFTVSQLGIPPTVREIGESAFSGISNATKITLNEGLEIIGDFAFSGQNLKEITIPASVKWVGNAAFVPYRAGTLAKVTFLCSAAELGKGIFGYSTLRATAQYVNENRNAILAGNLPLEMDESNPEYWEDKYTDDYDDSAEDFALFCYPGSTADRLYTRSVKKTWLKWTRENILTAPAERVLAEGVVSPGDNIYELVVPEGVEEIADNALAGTALTKVTLPSTLKKIGAGAFKGCAALGELTLPKGLEEIGESAFADCQSLQKINIPDAITAIPDRLFENCSQLSKLTLPKGGMKRVGSHAFDGCAMLTGIKLTKGLEEIGEAAFRNTGLKDGTVPDTVIRIGESAFAGSDITKLVLPKGLTEVPDQLCAWCYELKSAKLPSGITRIGKAAFYYCSSLSTVNFPEGLLAIDEQAFCQNLNYVAAANSMGKKATRLGALKFPASLQTIGQLAFAGCDTVDSVTFAKGSVLLEIAPQAFALCARLQSVALPDSVRTVGGEAFSHCIKLAKVNLGAGLVSAGEKLFNNCPVLTSLVVPDTLAEIGDNLLEGHGSKLKVTCAEGSAMDAWLQKNAPDVKTIRPKKK